MNNSSTRISQRTKRSSKGFVKMVFSDKPKLANPAEFNSDKSNRVLANTESVLSLQTQLAWSELIETGLMKLLVSFFPQRLEAK